MKNLSFHSRKLEKKNKLNLKKKNTAEIKLKIANRQNQ